jgi:hypothetical protein
MAIYRLMQRGAFGPEDISVLSAAYERALAQLQLTDRNDPVTEMIATRIIDVFRTGLRDPEDVCAEVLKGLRG